MDKKVYTKLSDLVDQDFTVEKVWGYQWKKWDDASKRMLLSEKWEEGYRKMYGIVTDKGQLDIGAGQLGSMLEGVSKEGEASIVGKTFHVKSNMTKEQFERADNETKKKIRYFINPVYGKPKEETFDNEPLDLPEGW